MHRKKKKRKEQTEGCRQTDGQQVCVVIEQRYGYGGGGRLGDESRSYVPVCVNMCVYVRYYRTCTETETPLLYLPLSSVLLPLIPETSLHVFVRVCLNQEGYCRPEECSVT